MLVKNIINWPSVQNDFITHQVLISISEHKFSSQNQNAAIAKKLIE